MSEPEQEPRIPGTESDIVLSFLNNPESFARVGANFQNDAGLRLGHGFSVQQLSDRYEEYTTDIIDRIEILRDASYGKLIKKHPEYKDTDAANAIQLIVADEKSVDQATKKYLNTSAEAYNEAFFYAGSKGGKPNLLFSLLALTRDPRLAGNFLQTYHSQPRRNSTYADFSIIAAHNGAMARKATAVNAVKEFSLKDNRRALHHFLVQVQPDIVLNNKEHTSSIRTLRKRQILKAIGHIANGDSVKKQLNFED